MYKLQCKTCKHIIEVDVEAWNTLEKTLNYLPDPFISSALKILDKMSSCCNDPDYWELYKINED